MSSRHRLYLNLKKSILKLFKTRAYYLKEMTSKWSILEKPYLDQDYRGMHLEITKPDWGTWKFPELEARRKRKFGWETKAGGESDSFYRGDRKCSIGIGNGVCGETFSISATCYNCGAVVFRATSSDPSKAFLILDDYQKMELALAQRFWGSAKEISRLSDPSQQSYPPGSPFASFTFQVPEEIGSYPPWGPSNPEIKVTICIKAGKYNCGCTDVTILCDTCNDSTIAWDDPNSADTIARNTSAAVAILDTLGKGGPYTWSVSGTGFTLTNAQTIELTNTLNADGTACGTATITVTGCSGRAVTGDVRCTTGTWSVQPAGTPCPPGDFGTMLCGGGVCANVTRYSGKYRVVQGVTLSYSSCSDLNCNVYGENAVDLCASALAAAKAAAAASCSSVAGCISCADCVAVLPIAGYVGVFPGPFTANAGGCTRVSDTQYYYPRQRGNCISTLTVSIWEC